MAHLPDDFIAYVTFMAWLIKTATGCSGQFFFFGMHFLLHVFSCLLEVMSGAFVSLESHSWHLQLKRLITENALTTFK